MMMITTQLIPNVTPDSLSFHSLSDDAHLKSNIQIGVVVSGQAGRRKRPILPAIMACLTHCPVLYQSFVRITKGFLKVNASKGNFLMFVLR